MIIGSGVKTAGIVLASVLALSGIAGVVSVIVPPSGPVNHASTVAVAAAPAGELTKPAAQNYSITQTRVAELSEIAFLYASAPVKDMNIQQAIDTAMPQVYKQMKTAGSYVRGNAMLVSDGFTGTDKPFELQAGFPVAAEIPTAPDGLQLRVLPATKAATAVFTGDIKFIGEAYTQVYADIEKMGLTPAGEWRQHNLYRDDHDEASNVILIQVPVK